jgi:hypothetical protein
LPVLSLSYHDKINLKSKASSSIDGIFATLFFSTMSITFKILI